MVICVSRVHSAEQEASLACSRSEAAYVAMSISSSFKRIPSSTSEVLATVLPNLELIQQLGSGSYGTVHLARDRSANGAKSPREVALKIVDTKNSSFIQRRWLKSEISIWMTLKHENIIKLIQTVEDWDKTLFIMEYARGGDLRNHINKNGPLPDSEARRIMRQICEALRYTHGMKCIHRDLKLDNILLDEHEHVKLADWGFAGHWQTGEVNTEAVGSLHYSAPEILQGQQYVGPEVDCWSLGVILYALVTAALPFMPDEDAEDAEVKLRDQIVRADFSIPATVSTTCQALIYGLLEPNSRARLTIDDVLNHDWMHGNAAARGVTAAMLRRRASPPALVHSMMKPKRPFQITFFESPPALTGASRAKPNSLRRALQNVSSLLHLSHSTEKHKQIPECHAVPIA